MQRKHGDFLTQYRWVRRDPFFQWLFKTPISLGRSSSHIWPNQPVAPWSLLNYLKCLDVVKSKNDSPSCIVQKNKTTSWWRKSGESVEIGFYMNKTLWDRQVRTLKRWEVTITPGTHYYNDLTGIQSITHKGVFLKFVGQPPSSNKSSRTRHIGYLTFFKWVWKPGCVLKLARSNCSYPKSSFSNKSITVSLINARMHKQVPLNK